MSTDPKPGHKAPQRKGWLFPVIFIGIVALCIGYFVFNWSDNTNAGSAEHANCTHEHAAEDDHAHSQPLDESHVHSHGTNTPDEHEHEEEIGHSHEADHSHDTTPSSSKVSSSANKPVAGKENTLTISSQAEKNISLTTTTIKLEDFQRTISIPGRVVEQAGHSRVKVSAPMSGTVERIFAIRGEAVEPDQALFQLRITHEEVIRRQTDLLKLAQQLDVVNREIKRLEKITASGAIAGKTLLNAQYEAEKLKGGIKAEKQGLQLLGLTKKQVDKIIAEKLLIENIEVLAPLRQERHETCTCEFLLQVAQIDVLVGQKVETGETLSMLTDYCFLMIEGQALEQDTATLNNAVKKKIPITAMIEQQGEKTGIVDLQILFLDSEVDMDTRALRFYTYLPNNIINNVKSPEGRRFVEWKFRPGQRVEIFLPIESWSDCIVLPREAVIQDGLESVVFVKKGEKVTKTPIVEQYRDSRVVVVTNDGTLTVDEKVVVNGAYQLFLKMKNRSAPIDPHAGHHH